MLVDGQQTKTQRDAPLVFTEAIPLEKRQGTFRSFCHGGGGRLFVAALGSNAVEVINIGGRILDHAITGVPDPQGIAFAPEMNRIFVADNMRYDPATKRVYVGCGDDEKTGKLGGEPESFRLEKSGPNIYVNVPDRKEIAVVNRDTKQRACASALSGHGYKYRSAGRRASERSGQ